MDPKEILKFCIDRGLLIDPEVLNLFSEASDTESVKMIIEKLKSHTQRRIITKNLFVQNREQVNEFFLTLPKENQKKLEKMKIKLGLQIEISKEVSSEKKIYMEEISGEEKEESVKILSKPLFLQKKIEVADFVRNLRNRFYEIKTILQEHTELNNLVSINKLSRDSHSVSIIGIVSN
ncbi:MAG TPA: hypothetical protein ENI22_01690, partial [Candidatus Pacearchaeota archaeon]|nr:hypothetical protein [Candidatus Pacearchaeota archaeon]